MKKDAKVKKLLRAGILLLLTAANSYADSSNPTCASIFVAKPWLSLIISSNDTGPIPIVVPNDYVLSPVRDKEVRSSLLLIADINTFGPVKSAYFQNRTSNKEYITILIDNMKPLGTILKLALWSNYVGRVQNDDPTGVEDENGLISQSGPGKPHFSDVFFARNSPGLISDVISCAQYGDVKMPTCTYMFREYGFSLKIVFSRYHLDGWKSIRIRTAEFLKCMMDKKPSPYRKD